MCRQLLFLPFLVLFWPTSLLQNAAHADESKPQVDVDRLANRLMETFDLVIRHHLYPPTKQQMVQESITAAYLNTNQNPPLELAQEISTADASMLEVILQRELTKVGENGLQYTDCIPLGLRAISVVATPSDAQIVNDQIAANRYVGIGIAIMQSTSEPRMAKIFPGGPASLAGAEDDDTIVKVDGKSTDGVPLAKVIEWIRGVRGSQVEIVIRRDGRLETLKMTREVVPFATVQPAVYSKSRRTAGIKLDRVSASNVHELRKIADVLDSNVSNVVLDLRTTAGVDSLHYGELLGNALLDHVPIGSVMDRSGERRQLISEPGAIFAGRKVTVIVDSQTGGVLKWIAAAFQDSGQAVTCGAPSAVPAVTSTTFQLKDGSFSITMPTHFLTRAGGQLLARNKTTVVGFPLQNSLQVRLNVSTQTRGRNAQAEGTLYPDESFPLLRNERLRNPSGMDPRMPRVQQLEAMLEAFERAESAVRGPPKKT